MVRLTQCKECGTVGKNKVPLHLASADSQAENDKLRAALEPFARAYYGFRERGELMDVNSVIPVSIRFGDLIAAFEAHEGEGPDGE